MTRLYLMNSPVLTGFGVFQFEPISIEAARALVQQASDVVSAIGHEATADLMTSDLGIIVEFIRNEVQFQVGEVALVFRLKNRLPEGRILDRSDLTGVEYEYGLLHRIE